MNIVRDDLKRLRLPIALAVISVVLGAVCLIASGNYLDAAREARTASRQGRLAAQERVSKVSEEERDIRENLTYYEQMRAHGMVGVQNRLDWIETIARIKNTRKLYEIKYSIEAQKPLDYPGIVSVQNADAEFVVSRMKLDMMLLHEDDLLGFLDDLRQEGKAHVTVKRCMVQRLGAVTALQPRLRAECLVDLVSLKVPGPA